MNIEQNKKKLIYGFGVNDLGYVVNKQIQKNGIRTWIYKCPFYEKWRDMIKRAYSLKFKDKFSTYSDVVICQEWSSASVFKSWMEGQIWVGLQLDKDILLKGNRIYSPETCAFVPSQLNSILNINLAKRSDNPIGVKKIKNGKFEGRLNDQGSKVYLGTYASPERAHQAWQWAKAEQIERAVVWYATQDCFRNDVADALTQRVWQLRLDHVEGKETTCL